MKSMMKILSRYVLSAVGIALFLLLVNFSVLVTWTVQSSRIIPKDKSISQLSDGLTFENSAYTLSAGVKASILKQYQWAMLLNDDGSVVWSLNLPDGIPLTYTISDTAGFTRWYLNDYPVHVWRRNDGLFVLGSKKDSMWKHAIELPRKALDNALLWLPAILILNAVIAVLLALLLGLRLFRSLKPLAKGIEDMAEKQPVELSANGLLGDLAAGINKASAQLVKQEAALTKRDNARTTWIAGISHDIRTPLSLVMGYASQLENDPELPPAKREQACIIRRQSERIKILVSDLNLASKLEYNMQPIHKTTVQPAVFLRSVTADFINNGLDDIFAIDVIINDNAQNIAVTGDEELLRRAVSNLISNSVRHNPKGCTVSVNLETNLGNCSLSVSDNGVGFTPEILSKLNSAKGSAKLENHGLGLTIVQQIMKAHGGTTEFRNLPKGGCIIILCLPVSNVIAN